MNKLKQQAPCVAKSCYGEDPSTGKIMPAPATQELFCKPFDYYLGMWSDNTRIPGNPAGFKYSGGLATYPHQQGPQAIYSAPAKKTFFCYGGTLPGNHEHYGQRKFDFQPGNLMHMVSYFDHATGELAQPICVFDKWCADPHDNPILQIDKAGFLYLFSPSHGEWTTRSFVHRSLAPYDITRWETPWDGELYAYPHVWPVDQGFLFLHTIYEQGRGLFFRRGVGQKWDSPKPLAVFGQGHYQVTAHDPESGKIATLFNYHPEPGGLDKRTNLYFAVTGDGGTTWENVLGEKLSLPLNSVNNPALLHDYENEGRLCYLKDLVFLPDSSPLALFLLSTNHLPGPGTGIREWMTARFDGGQWRIRSVCESNNNYDMGTFHIQSESHWRLIAPVLPGPQEWSPGGEVAALETINAGLTWQQTAQITSGSEYNHTFVRRPVNAHPDFRAFWADGSGTAPSASCLYYCNDENQVFRMCPGTPERIH